MSIKTETLARVMALMRVAQLGAYKEKFTGGDDEVNARLASGIDDPEEFKAINDSIVRAAASELVEVSRDDLARTVAEMLLLRIGSLTAQEMMIVASTAGSNEQIMKYIDENIKRSEAFLHGDIELKDLKPGGAY